jgi:2',3'-cyclic-nucleotide 2'-phosphodiesterase (5'-nucleotidase family)
MKTTVAHILLVIVSALTVLPLACTGAARQPDTLYGITILHSNDTHAHLDLVAQRAEMIQQVRTTLGEDNLMLLDAGDVFAGTPYFSLYHGLADLWFFNYMAYDAVCLGNHEFDEGPPSLSKFLDGVKFPVVNANLDFSREPLLNGRVKPSVVIDRAGYKFGVFGLLTGETAVISSPGPTVSFNDYTAAARQAVSGFHSQGINRIIDLTHIGWDFDLKLARDVEGIDLIVGGHSHTVPDKYPTLAGADTTPTMVVQAGAYNQYLGRLDLKFDGNGVIRQWQGSQLNTITDKLAANSDCAAKLKEYSAPLDKLYQTAVGKTLVALNGDRINVRSVETNLGNLICDSMLWRAAGSKPDVAITNGGSIRASLPPGDITLGGILSVLPFNVTYQLVEVTGSQLLAALENGVSMVEQGEGRFPQVAGLRFSWNPKGQPGSRIQSVEIKIASGYKPLDPAAKYRVVLSSYMAGGGDGYAMFKTAETDNLGLPDYDTLAEYIKAYSPVSPGVEGRITRVS